MSEPDATTVATVAEIVVPVSGSVASVERGPVDLFALDGDGVRLPLATLGTGDAAFGAADPVVVIAVPRQGASVVLAPVDPVTSEALLARFVARLQAQLGDQAASLTGVAPSGFADAFAAVVMGAERADTVEREAQAQLALAVSKKAFDESLERIAYSSSTLRDAGFDVAAGPLVTVLTLVGQAEGFAVVAPTPEALRSTSDPLRLIAHTSGVRYRPVNLRPGWMQRAQGSFLSAVMGDDGVPTPVALLKAPGKGYLIQRPDDEAPVRLSDDVAARLVPSAFEFYAPLTPDRVATVGDVIRLGLHGMGRLWLLAAGMALGVALLGMLTPILTNMVVGSIIPSGEQAVLVQVGLALVVAACVSFVFMLVQNFTVSLISQRATRSMQAAFWDRVFSLPAAFFRNYSSGDLTVRVLAVDTLQSLVSSQVVSAALAAVFGMVNLFLMFRYDTMLGIAGLVFIALTLVVLYLGVRGVARQATASLAASRQANGWLVQMLQGIMKIRLANAESRLEARYFDIARRQNLALSRQTLVVGRISAWFVFAASGATAFFYLVVLVQWEGSAPISTADYMAFSSAYAMAFAGVAGLSALISPIANAGPTFNLLQPIMTELPETAGNRQDPGRLTGHIELRDVFFRYTPDGPMILKGLNLTIEPGTMVALVGPSGAGKSTITRQLLGFDQPERGQVLFDGRDLQNLDPTLVRNQMGVVVQEGTITRGSIMRNILSAGSHDEALAWRAAERAALADDIRNMPMGMQTIVDPGNVSGGQAQRILLARALVRDPAILILDEATSALDNASQAIVTEAMKALNATRIVIAHRLSTIRTADRIIVMEAGTAVESGTYDELLAKDGVFAALVKRQVA